MFQNISEFKNIKNRIKRINDDQKKEMIINYFDWLLSVAFTYTEQLTSQHKLDINIEMVRGTRILSLCEITSNIKY